MYYKINHNFFLINQIDEELPTPSAGLNPQISLGIAPIITKPAEKGLKMYGNPGFIVKIMKERFLKTLWNPYQDPCVLTNIEGSIQRWLILSLVEFDTHPIQQYIEALNAYEEHIRYMQPNQLILTLPTQDLFHSQLGGRQDSVIDPQVIDWLYSFSESLPSFMHVWVFVEADHDFMNHFYRLVLSKKWESERQKKMDPSVKFDPLTR